MVDVVNYSQKYLGDRQDPSARYASFDHCFNYFRDGLESNDPDALIGGVAMQSSCLHLGFYLASWGMFRGSAALLQKSAKALEPAIRFAANAPTYIRDADVAQYDEDLIKELLSFGKTLGAKLPGGNSDTLITKAMLGIFGCVPAFDRFFRVGFGTSGFNKKTMHRLREFYEDHQEAIESQRVATIDFDGNTTRRTYTQAKVLDMVFFTKGLQSS